MVHDTIFPVRTRENLPVIVQPVLAVRCEADMQQNETGRSRCYLGPSEPDPLMIGQGRQLRCLWNRSGLASIYPIFGAQTNVGSP